MRNNKRIVFWAVVFLAVSWFLVGPAFGAYAPPVGIPDPAASWGGTIDPIDDVAPAQPSAWPSGEAAGYYYIDKSHPSATDTGNPYGYPNKPRITIPSTFAAGSYVEVHGGPYSNVTVTANGTATNPVWFRGTAGSNPTFRGFSMKGSYAIFEYLNFDRQTEGAAFDYPSAYMTLRYSTYVGEGTYIGSNGSAFGCSGDSASQHNHHILFYANNISNIGQWNYDTTYDYHGIKPRNDVDYVWILDCNIYHTQGDSVQTGEASLIGQNYPSHIYIGRLRSYEEKENCVDIKGGSDIVVSEIVCSDLNNSYGDDEGGGVVIHNNASWVWVLNSLFYRNWIGALNTDGSNIYYVGNIARNINGSTSSTSYYGSGVAFHVRNSSTVAIVNNTVNNCDKGVQIATGVSSIRIANDIFSSRLNSSTYDIMAASTSAVTVDSALQDTELRVYWGGTTYTTVSGFQATGQCVRCPTEASPQFVNEAGDDFRLQSTSPAIDAGVSEAVYATFSNRYGFSIGIDRSSVTRPQSAGWDIGAYEFGGGGGGAGLQPNPPTGLHIISN